MVKIQIVFAIFRADIPVGPKKIPINLIHQISDRPQSDPETPL